MGLAEVEVKRSVGDADMINEKPKHSLMSRITCITLGSEKFELVAEELPP